MLCDVPNRPPDCCCVVVVAVFPPPKRDIFVGQRVCAQSSRDQARSLRNLGERVVRFIQTRGHQSRIQATAAVIANAAFICLGKLRTRLALSLSRDAVHDRRPPARPWQMRPSSELNLRDDSCDGQQYQHSHLATSGTCSFHTRGLYSTQHSHTIPPSCRDEKQGTKLILRQDEH